MKSKHEMRAFVYNVVKRDFIVTAIKLKEPSCLAAQIN